MMEGAVKTLEPTAEQLAFRFVSGHRALDFLATFADRHRQGVERLRQPADLDRWLRAAGLPASRTTSARDLDHARGLREAINRLARASMQGKSGDRKDITCLNEWARRSQLTPQLDREFHRCWRSRDPVVGALALIAREAVELLSGPERELIRECAAAPACSLLYLDRSRGRRRRWCEMERCGSRAKMSDYRQRQATPSDTDPAPSGRNPTAQPPSRSIGVAP
jgi:predicted RNA-binding Zn ribbon-like protein